MGFCCSKYSKEIEKLQNTVYKLNEKNKDYKNMLDIKEIEIVIITERLQELSQQEVERPREE